MSTYLPSAIWSAPPCSAAPPECKVPARRRFRYESWPQIAKLGDLLAMRSPRSRRVASYADKCEAGAISVAGPHGRPASLTTHADSKAPIEGAEATYSRDICRWHVRVRLVGRAEIHSGRRGSLQTTPSCLYAQARRAGVTKRQRHHALIASSRDDSHRATTGLQGPWNLYFGGGRRCIKRGIRDFQLPAAAWRDPRLTTALRRTPMASIRRFSASVVAAALLALPS
jgi:hypothetical protein